MNLKKLPKLGQIVKPTGYNNYPGKWIVKKLDYKPDNYNIYVENDTIKKGFWISADAIDD
jgi:hypothetical protein